ncbi:unnamed protein product [Alopecurus aequalis]
MLVIPRGQVAEEINELSFRNLYLHHTLSGPSQNQSIVVHANAVTGLGTTTVNNWTIHDVLGPYAPVVARGQGLHVSAGGWHNSFAIVFETERYACSVDDALNFLTRCIQLAPSEYIKEFSGTTGYHENHLVVSSLKFVTSYRTYGPFGRMQGDDFKSPIPNNGIVVGFFGRSGASLDAIGVYTI